MLFLEGRWTEALSLGFACWVGGSIKEVGGTTHFGYIPYSIHTYLYIRLSPRTLASSQSVVSPQGKTRLDTLPPLEVHGQESRKKNSADRESVFGLFLEFHQ